MMNLHTELDKILIRESKVLEELDNLSNITNGNLFIHFSYNVQKVIVEFLNDIVELSTKQKNTNGNWQKVEELANGFKSMSNERKLGSMAEIQDVNERVKNGSATHRDVVAEHQLIQYCRMHGVATEVSNVVSTIVHIEIVNNGAGESPV